MDLKVIIFVALAVLIIAFFFWCLCRMSKISDQYIEELFEEDWNLD
jgi:hypothetical protein